MTPIHKLGQRICVIGCSSSGKSTLADKLSNKFGIPECHLDFLAHKPNSNWERDSDDSLVRRHNQIINQEKWIVDGNYSVCMKSRFSRATSIIWLDFNVFSCLLRYISRSLKNNPERPGRLMSAKKEFSLWLLKHILFIYPKKRIKYSKLIKQYPDLIVVHITSMRSLKAYYKYWRLN